MLFLRMDFKIFDVKNSIFWRLKLFLVEHQRKGEDPDQSLEIVVEGQGQETGIGDPGNYDIECTCKFKQVKIFSYSL